MNSTSPFKPGLMAPPIPQTPRPGLMVAIPARPGRGFMEPHPDAPAFEWSRDGVAFLWLVALILAFVVTASLLAHGQA
jgi:hypothetical protein